MGRIREGWQRHDIFESGRRGWALDDGCEIKDGIQQAFYGLTSGLQM
jgi:hypothetical protein